MKRLAELLVVLSRLLDQTEQPQAQAHRRINDPLDDCVLVKAIQPTSQ